MDKKRVVITGLGALSPISNNAKELWQNGMKGQNGIGEITRIDTTDFEVSVAGELKGYDALDHFSKKEARKMDRFTQYAIVASREAVLDSGLKIEGELSERVGVWIGSGIGGIGTFEIGYDMLLKRGPKRVSPFFVPMMITDMAAGQVSIDLGAKGPNGCTVTACATGTNSIGEAFKFIQRGDATAMVAGGTEAPISRMGLAGFQANKALTLNPDPNSACRPFDANRDGFVMSEGAGVVILEELEHAKARGAHIYAEVVGYGSTGDAHHITAPAPGGSGGSRAMTMAIEDAGIQPTDVDYINAHGTSTPLNEKFETMAIKDAFGDHAYNMKISSTKSMTGHMLGAAGGIEAIFSALSLEHGIILPTINYVEKDPECDLDYVPNEMIKQDIKYALSNSLGFGGHNSTLMLKRYEG